MGLFFRKDGTYSIYRRTPAFSAGTYLLVSLIFITGCTLNHRRNGSLPLHDPIYRMAPQSHGESSPTWDSCQFCWPLGCQGKISSKFGPRKGRHHDGVDVAAPKGTPVLAAENGEVVHIGIAGKGAGKGYGNYIVLHHGNGIYSLYAHLDQIQVKKEQKVVRQMHIGKVGTTGNATGPHLHFEIIHGTDPVDPLPYLPVS